VLGHRSRALTGGSMTFSTRAGCVHFIAASGTNIVILMGPLWLAGRLVGLDHRQCAWLMIARHRGCTGFVAEARPPFEGVRDGHHVLPRGIVSAGFGPPPDFRRKR